MMETVLGKSDGNWDGMTLMHEHIIASSPVMTKFFGDAWLDKELVVARSLERLAIAKAAGVGAIVDGTALNLGRDVELIGRISQESGMPICISTGMYYPGDFAFMRMPADVLAAYFIDEVVDGIGESGVRPAIYKVAVERAQLTDEDIRYLHVAALVSIECGLPIYVHTNAGHRNGLEAVDRLKEWGVPAESIVVGHCLDSYKLDYPLELLQKGTSLCCDRIFRGGDGALKKADMVAELCTRGYADRLVLSHDYICCEDKWNGKYPNERRPGTVHDDLRGLCVVADVVLPRLKERGIPEDQLRKITVDNPRRILAGKPKKGNRE